MVRYRAVDNSSAHLRTVIFLLVLRLVGARSPILLYCRLLWKTGPKMMVNCHRYFLGGIFVNTVNWEFRTFCFGGASFNLDFTVPSLRHESAKLSYYSKHLLQMYCVQNWIGCFPALDILITWQFTLGLHIFRIEFINASVAGYAPSRRLLDSYLSTLNQLY